MFHQDFGEDLKLMLEWYYDKLIIRMSMLFNYRRLASYHLRKKFHFKSVP